MGKITGFLEIDRRFSNAIKHSQGFLRSDGADVNLKPRCVGHEHLASEDIRKG